MTELMELKIESTLPSFITNFEEVKLQVQQQLLAYDIIVNLENLPEAKKLATELNLFAKIANEKRISKEKEVSAPIKAFKEKVDEIITLYNEGREKLLKQVKTFEDETRKNIVNLANEYLQENYHKFSIREEFKKITVEDLGGSLTNLTDRGVLTLKAKNEIASRVNVIAVLQFKVDKRIADLENACLKAGLKSLLQKRHIENFINDPDNQYIIKLQRFIEAELERQDEIEKKLQVELENKRIQQEKILSEKKASEVKVSLFQTIEPNVISDFPTLASNSDNNTTKCYRVTATFEIVCKSDNMGDIRDKYNEKLRDSFKTLVHVDINFVGNL